MSEIEASTPQIGIVYMVADDLFIDATPLAHASRLGDFAVHERDHIFFWEELVRTGAVPLGDYRQHPRGRIAYNLKTAKFTFLADRCILGNDQALGAILRRMRIARSRVEIGFDPQYRCSRCRQRI